MAVNVELSLHKARELMAPYRNAMPINNPLPAIHSEPPDPPNVLVDAVSLGGPTDARQKPLVRHVLVKDLWKIGKRMKYELPIDGVFANRASLGLYAIFDGQSCAGDPGPMAAEFCARNFHLKLLKRLADLPSDSPPDEPAIQAVLAGTFDDLDAELMANQEVQDGCGAAVALLIGDIVFTAALGQCAIVLGAQFDGQQGMKPIRLGGRQGVVEGDIMRIRYAGGVVFGDQGVVRIRHPMTSQESGVSRALGNRSWKDTQAGLKTQIVLAAPDMYSTLLRGPDEHPFLLLTASTVAACITPQEAVTIGAEFLKQPRATCGEIATRAAAARAGAAQCTAVEICFLPKREKRPAGGVAGANAGPAAKKAKISNAPGGGTQSVRLRHILLKFVPDGAPAPKDGKKPGGRTRQEAEATLRKALSDLRAELRTQKKAPKDALELVANTTKKWSELCKTLSECDTSKKGGAMCGDLGWLSPEELTNFGGSLKEVVDTLLPGQFSDIASTDSGLHLVQRVA